MKRASYDASLTEELPYWDFASEPRAHAILMDGSLVGGLSVSLADIECFDEGEVNQFTMGLRAALNSISEGVSLQFVLRVRSDFSDLIDNHTRGKAENIHPLVKTIADHRERDLTLAMEQCELYRPELFVYLRTPMVAGRKISVLKKKELFSDAAGKAYQETLEVLGQNIDTLIFVIQ